MRKTFLEREKNVEDNLLTERKIFGSILLIVRERSVLNPSMF